MAAPAARTLAFRIHGPIRREDLAGLCDRVCALLGEHEPALALCEVGGVEPDAVTVDALARLQLAARRRGCVVRLANASAALADLVELMGLTDVLVEPHARMAAMPLELEFDETFAAGVLDPARWLPHHLPQWSSRRRAAARYALEPRSLRLRIDADQEPWCPEWDGATRVSSLQTGVFAGAVGSTVGQHRFHPEAVVREAQETRRLYTPRFGRVEIVARFPDDPAAMGALWLIGFEDEPERSGELCVCEIFGRDVAGDRVRVGMGIHPFGDPLLSDDFEQVPLELDVREPHSYAAEWEPGAARFFVDGTLVKESAQAPDYPLQLMLGLYEFRDGGPSGRYPKELVVERVRGYRLVA